MARSRADSLILPDPALPSVGDPIAPSLEVIAGADPDLIVAWRGMDVDRLRRLTPPATRILALEIASFQDLDAAIDTLGRLVGAEGAADSLRGELDAQVATATASRKGRVRPAVAWVVWPRPLMLAGRGTFIDEVLDAAGGRNVLAPDEGRWPVVGMETLVTRDPDVIVWPRGGGIPPPPGPGGLWDEIRAYRDGSVLRPFADRFHVPGPESGAAVLELSLALDSLSEARR